MFVCEKEKDWLNLQGENNAQLNEKRKWLNEKEKKSCVIMHTYDGYVVLFNFSSFEWIQLSVFGC